MEEATIETIRTVKARDYMEISLASARDLGSVSDYRLSLTNNIARREKEAEGLIVDLIKASACDSFRNSISKAVTSSLTKLGSCKEVLYLEMGKDYVMVDVDLLGRPLRMVFRMNEGVVNIFNLAGDTTRVSVKRDIVQTRNSVSELDTKVKRSGSIVPIVSLMEKGQIDEAVGVLCKTLVACMKGQL